MKPCIPLLIVIVFFLSCERKKASEANASGDTQISDIYDPEEGFNIEGSDVIAIYLADQVMAAMGVKAAWDATHFLRWTVNEERTIIWDKKLNRARIEILEPQEVYLLDGETEKGTIFKNGEKVYEADSLAKYLQIGHEMWKQDSYWLAMPFQLKGKGTTLYYLGEDSTLEGQYAQKIQVAFDQAQPPYLFDIWIDPETDRISQWGYYPNHELPEPIFITSWSDYEKYGKIFLSSKRGDYQLTDIAILESIPDHTFKSL